MPNAPPLQNRLGGGGGGGGVSELVHLYATKYVKHFKIGKVGTEVALLMAIVPVSFKDIEQQTLAYLLVFGQSWDKTAVWMEPCLVSF